ncbi:proline racemase family protein [Bryobacter aggregatus]|uniref:proline racemase family protein n=1 Tax=Bryobacter aggregatus TaxID=360054 RepID=UPI0004E26E03|nr:proline racemase family protein [Bryobacter aggregatus]
MTRVRVIDSHTGGEPTRVVVEGAPDLGRGTMSDRLNRFREDYDHFRSAVVNEPRGSDVMVGAVLLPPDNPENRAGVLYFNNVGYLGMCGHGTIGVVTVMNYLGLIEAGRHMLETPVGAVIATLTPTGEVTVENVPSYRYRKGVECNVDGLGLIRGDIAWGGNWFFLVDAQPEILRIEDVEHWTNTAARIREALHRENIRGENNAEIDHIELFGPSPTGADSRNFVLCPGMAYDRSPCGTGTSAKLACLAADGKLAEDAIWRQESIVGSEFQGSYRWEGDRVRPSITGRAYVNADASLLLDSRDPFCWGIRR